jgi:hypothetical protein
MVFPCLVTLFVFFSNALSYVRQGAEHFDIAPEHSLPDATFLSSGLDEDVVMGDEVKEGVAEVSSGDAHKRVDAANAADGQQQEQGEKEEEGEGEEAAEGAKKDRADWENMDSKWAAEGWLRENPLGAPTEREFYVTQRGLPVYRTLLMKK